LSLWLAGGFPDEMGFDDANDLVGMAVMLGRAVPAGKWVEDMIEQARSDTLKSLF